MTWTEFFSLRISHIYFVYGLAFFSMGLAVALEIGRGEPTRFRRAMRPLAVFGIMHGLHEWLDMFAIVGQYAYHFQPGTGFGVLRLAILSISFASLIAFGVQMLRSPKHLPHPDFWIGSTMLILYGLGVLLLGQWLNWQQPAWLAAADALARYSLAIPGAILAAWALMVQRQDFLRLNQPGFANDLLWVATAFVLYGVVGQFFVNPSFLFPSTIINANTFQDWFVIPVQLFRAVMGIIIAIFMIRALRAFEFYRRQELDTARRRVQEEITQRDALRQEFLHRVVETQEEERTRIARELHDELGQTLTGLAIGLRGVQISPEAPSHLQRQLNQLEAMVVQAMGDMRRLVNELRPALLDDMGLPAALRHYTETFSSLTNIETSLAIGQHHARLPGEVETSLFRIAQEALTNVARHAGATKVNINLRCPHNYAMLQISDNGAGFNPAVVSNGDNEASWGLMGIQERVKLANGDLQITSAADTGTTLTVNIPLERQSL